MTGSFGCDEHHERRLGASLLSRTLRELADVRQARDAGTLFGDASCDTGLAMPSRHVPDKLQRRMATPMGWIRFHVLVCSLDQLTVDVLLVFASNKTINNFTPGEERAPCGFRGL